MALNVRRYRIGARRIEQAFTDGFELSEGGVFTSAGTGTVSTLFFPYLDSATDSYPWGRLVFETEVSEDTVFTVKTLVSDTDLTVYRGEERSLNDILLSPDVTIADKDSLFGAEDESHSSIYSDMLLNGQEGRYLWISLTVQGGRASFWDFRAYAPGDTFLSSLPEVYREQDSFIGRYLSVFSSLYNDLQEHIDHTDDLLDIDKAPAALLPVLATWFGIRLDGDFIDEHRMRRFLKKAYELIRGKGTRKAIEDLVGIFVDEPFFIVEYSDAFGVMDDAMHDTLANIYGDDPLSFTLLLQHKPDEKLQLRLMRLINQFKPMRMRVRIGFIEERVTLDGGANLDVNARIARPAPGKLDDTAALNGTDYLS
jgi:phage tail-like protein